MATVSTGDRNPFICPSCDVVYSSSIDSDHAPSHSNACAHPMCVGCVKRKRKRRRRDSEELGESNGEREELSIDCVICQKETMCNGEPGVAYWLIDILVELESKAKQAFFATVSIKAEQLVSLKCAGCEMYTNSHHGFCSVFVLFCGHLLCCSCVSEKEIERTDEEREVEEEGRLYGYKLKCVQCPRYTLFEEMEQHGEVIQEVVTWLNKKREDQIQALPCNIFTCSDCGQKTPYDRGFICTDCTKRDGGDQRMLCGFCIYDAHKTHSGERFLPIKLQSMKDSSLMNIKPKIAQSNSEANEVVDEYKALLGKVEECFSSAIDTIPLAPKCSDGMMISLQIQENAENYEDIMEKIIPSARIHNKMLEDMIAKLKETFPELNKDIGESGEEETRVDQTMDGESVEDEEDAEKDYDSNT